MEEPNPCPIFSRVAHLMSYGCVKTFHNDGSLLTWLLVRNAIDSASRQTACK